MTYPTRYNKVGLMMAMMLALLVLSWSTAQAQDEHEKSLWESVHCNKKQQMELYLKFYPGGAYVDEARSCLGELAEEKLRLKLLECAAHFNANRLLTGQGGNAQECYQQVLEMAPGNAQARSGLTAIKDKYITWVKRELQRHDVTSAQTYLHRLKTLNEGHKEVAKLEQRIEKAMKAQKKRKLAKLAELALPFAGKMVAIPGGNFRMGSLNDDENADDDEKPIHQVKIDSFQMGEHEVTVGQFRAFVKESGYRTDAEDDKHDRKGCAIYKNQGWQYRADRSWRPAGFRRHEAHPVVCVSHHDAQEFIAWLNKKTSLRYRLPTEAEWEYAARAGTTTQYSWGDNESEAGIYAWYDKNSGTRRVGDKEPNLWELYDMHGNVREWVQDWYDGDYYSVRGWVQDWYYGDYYSNSPVNNPQGPALGLYRVHRGGSWLYHARNLRSAYRNSSSPGSRVSDLGFRLVRQP